jgi:hypothetical protein
MVCQLKAPLTSVQLVQKISFLSYLLPELGRAIAQEVSRRIPTAAARVRALVRSCEICGGQSGTCADFLQVLQFPLPILIPPTALHSSSIIRGCYNRPISGQRTKRTVSPLPKKRKLLPELHEF